MGNRKKYLRKEIDSVDKRLLDKMKLEEGEYKM